MQRKRRGSRQGRRKAQTCWALLMHLQTRSSDRSLGTPSIAMMAPIWMGVSPMTPCGRDDVGRLSAAPLTGTRCQVDRLAGDHTGHLTVRGHLHSDLKAHGPVGGGSSYRAGGRHGCLSHWAGGATTHARGRGGTEGQAVQWNGAIWAPLPSSLSGNSTGPGGSDVPQEQLHCSAPPLSTTRKPRSGRKTPWLRWSRRHQRGGAEELAAVIWRQLKSPVPRDGNLDGVAGKWVAALGCHLCRHGMPI
eukprot:4704882-Ditylum_brightwellii.AAC.1